MTELQLTTFRGKRTKDGQWVVGNYVCGFYDPHVIIAPRLDAGVRIYEVNPSTVCIRVDGIHDKNGKEIFVGDIVQICDTKLNNDLIQVIELFRGKVIYSNGRFCLEDINGCLHDIASFGAAFLEVIGNVFDNPELLEVPHAVSTPSCFSSNDVPVTDCEGCEHLQYCANQYEPNGGAHGNEL